jgi:hypothetical protein
MSYECGELRLIDTDRGHPNNSGGKTCPRGTLSTTNLTRSGRGLHGERPAGGRRFGLMDLKARRRFLASVVDIALNLVDFTVWHE